jgi:hypothetical protein
MAILTEINVLTEMAFMLMPAHSPVLLVSAYKMEAL